MTALRTRAARSGTDALRVTLKTENHHGPQLLIAQWSGALPPELVGPAILETGLAFPGDTPQSRFGGLWTRPGGELVDGGTTTSTRSTRHIGT